MDQPAWINGGNRRAANYQSVLSEGIRDRKYGSVSVHMLKYIEQHSPCAFMVGMGNLQNPLPRFLKASGWALRKVPFLFRVLNVRKFLRELYVFRKNSYFRLASRAASVSGSGWLGVRLLQGRPAFGDASLRGLLTESVTGWGSWADEIWQQYRAQCSFAVVRDRTTLDLLYPVGRPPTENCSRQPKFVAHWMGRMDKYSYEERQILRKPTCHDNLRLRSSPRVCRCLRTFDHPAFGRIRCGSRNYESRPLVLDLRFPQGRLSHIILKLSFGDLQRTQYSNTCPAVKHASISHVAMATGEFIFIVDYH